MRSKREREEQTDGEVKRQRVEKDEEEEEVSSPKTHAFENPLLPLASYNDDDEEEEEGNVKKAEVNGRKNEIVDDDEDDEDEEDFKFGQGKHNRLVVVRRDCPYLDTVNRQVLDFFSSSIYGLLINVSYIWCIC